MLLFFSAKKSTAQTNINFNENCNAAYNLIVSLQINKAAKLITTEKKINPNNAVVAYLEHATDFVKFFVDENAADFKKMDEHLSQRLTTIENVETNTAWKNYLLAQMNLEAAIANGKMGNYITAFFEVRRANNLLNENLKKFPQFIPSKKGLGLIHCLIGTIPEKYRWGAGLFGFSGNLQQGMNELLQTKKFADENNFYCKHELNFIYVYGLLYMQNDKKTSWKIAKQLFEENPENKLYCFLAANVAQNTAQNEEAIAALNKKPSSNEYLAFDYLNYMQGLAMLRKLDTAKALVAFQKFVTTEKKRNFIKDAYQKIAWAYLLNNDSKNYSASIALCKKNGAMIVDADKQAFREANDNEQPNLILLKARLLSDGGYYEKAISILEEKKEPDFKSTKEKTEFVYRYGRIYADWGFPDKAIPFFSLAILFGKNLPQYFACNAALNLGLIFEQRKDKINAEKYYKMSIEMKNTDFKNGLEQKAKTGLERLKKIK